MKENILYPLAEKLQQWTGVLAELIKPIVEWLHGTGETGIIVFICCILFIGYLIDQGYFRAFIGWLLTIIFGLCFLASSFTTLAHIFHFNILKAMGFFFLSLFCLILISFAFNLATWRGEEEEY